MDTRLRKVEKEVLIPRHLEFKISREYCAEEARRFAECASVAGFKVTFLCKPLMKEFQECSNRYSRDEKIRKEAEQEYLEKRDKFRKTGVAEKSPFSRF